MTNITQRHVIAAVGSVLTGLAASKTAALAQEQHSPFVAKFLASAARNTQTKVSNRLE